MTTIADHIRELVARRPGLTTVELAADLFGDERFAKRLNPFCREMVADGLIVSRGRGGARTPYLYFLNSASANDRPPRQWSGWNVSSELASVPAGGWPAEMGGIAEPAMRQAPARTPRAPALGSPVTREAEPRCSDAASSR